jgi:hypothetical protein
MVNLDAVVIHVVINIIILAPVLWISGRLLAGKENAKFTDALWIAALGTIIGDLFGAFFSGVIALIIILFIWIALIKHFFDCGWLKALLIAIVAVLIFAAIAVLLTLIGIIVIGIWLL